MVVKCGSGGGKRIELCKSRYNWVISKSCSSGSSVQCTQEWSKKASVKGGETSEG